MTTGARPLRAVLVAVTVAAAAAAAGVARGARDFFGVTSVTAVVTLLVYAFELR